LSTDGFIVLKLPKIWKRSFAPTSSIAQTIWNVPALIAPGVSVVDGWGVRTFRISHPSPRCSDDRAAIIVGRVGKRNPAV